MNGIELYLQVIPLGLAAAVTPALIALQLLVMCGDRWLPRGLLVIAANALAFGIVIALLVLGFAHLPDAHTGTSTGLDALRFGCGLVLLVMAVYFLLPHPGLNARTQAVLEKRAAHARGWMFMRVVLGPRATPVLTRAYTWIMHNSLRVVGVILAVIGLWFSIGALVAW